MTSPLNAEVRYIWNRLAPCLGAEVQSHTSPQTCSPFAMLFPYTAFGFVLVATCLSLTPVSTAQTSPFVSRNNEGWSNDNSTNFACSSDPLPYDTSAFSHAESLHNLPRPALDFLFHLEANLSVVYPIGDGPLGNRQSIIGSGGRVEGPKIKGTLL